MRALTAETRARGGAAAIRAGSRAAVHATVADASPRPMSIGALAVACCLLKAVAACSSSSAPLSVFAAAGARPALDEIVRTWQRQRGDEIQVSYGAGGQVLARMAFFETGDVYVAPEQDFMKCAVEQAAVDPATIRDVAYLVPVLAVQKHNPKRLTALSDLARPGIRVAVTRPETTCLGNYAPQIFRRAGLATAIGENTVAQAPRPDLLMTWLVLGEVDAIITWHLYGRLAPDDIEVIWLPPEQLPGVARMQAAVSTYTGNRDLARRFVDFLASGDGRAIFERHGYIVDAEVLAKHWPDADDEPRDRPGLAGPSRR